MYFKSIYKLTKLLSTDSYEDKVEVPTQMLLTPMNESLNSPIL